VLDQRLDHADPEFDGGRSNRRLGHVALVVDVMHERMFP
jgi:hypothetical protein